MPCNCDHLEATSLEREGSRIACLLNELEAVGRSGSPPGFRHNRRDWSGYHPAVYGQTSRSQVDEQTAVPLRGPPRAW